MTFVSKCFPSTSPSTLPLLLCRRIQSIFSENHQQIDTKPRVYLLNQHKDDPASLEVALAALRAYSLFDRPESIEIALKCNMKYKKDKLRQPFRGSVVYPFTFGKQQRVLVFSEESLVQSAYDAGADVVGGSELVDKVSKGLEQFDVCLCTPTMLPEVKKLQNILRAKMPAIRRGTVVEKFDDPIRKLKNSREYHTDKQGYIFGSVAKLGFPNEKIFVNIKALVDEVLKHSETIPKKNFIDSATLSSTYGPGFLIDVQELITSDK